MITTIPAFPTADQPVTIIFDATQGNAGLENYSGSDVYAYTGVTTQDGSWEHVVELSWPDNPASCLMTKISANKYQLTISPSIRAFYNVPDTQQIEQLCFVFRKSTGSVSGRGPGGAEYIYSVYTVGLNVNFVLPANYYSIVDSGQKIPINITASLNDSISLYLDNVKIMSVKGQSLVDTIVAQGNYLHTLIAVADTGANSVSDTVTYLVPQATKYASVPAGLHDGIERYS